MNTAVSERAQAAYDKTNDVAARVVAMEDLFQKTELYRSFRDRVFTVLALREARLRAGKTDLKGAALIGAAGSGKSRFVAEIIKEHQALTEAAGDRQFGSRILSVIVPGRATVKETLTAILRELGHPASGRRDEDYLAQLVVHYLKEARIAGLHLDEVQDSGRYKTDDSMEVFLKRFRNMMQETTWPVCLIVTATPEMRRMFNLDLTFTRRMRPMEIKPITFAQDGTDIRKIGAELLDFAELKDIGLFAQDEFIKILIHAAAGRFGVAVELVIEAIAESLLNGDPALEMGHFADAYEIRMDCDEEMNPFVAEDWKQIDTMTALQRYIEERKNKRRAAK